MAMRKPSTSRILSRRAVLKLGLGAAAATVGARFLPGLGQRLSPAPHVARATGSLRQIALAATDGWITLPGTVPIPGGSGGPDGNFAPDVLAAPGQTVYVFGFRDVTGFSSDQVLNLKGQAQHSAPLLYVDEGEDVEISLFNLGFVMRPDLGDPHSVHWHGFRQAIPYFDGVPNTSIAVPLDRQFTYFYRPQDPGTYMYHCHVEDTEHVQMGMNGLLFVRPAQNSGAFKYVYNDGDGSTAYDREFSVYLSEMWAEAHWADAHIQLPEWTDYKPDWYMLNGRVYPDTLAPSSDLHANPFPEPAALSYQPHSAVISAHPGQKVLLRFASLGYEEQSMTLAGIPLRVVGKDATLLRGRNGEDLSYQTNTISIGPGESFDAIFTAPAWSGSGPYDTYLLYNRNLDRLRNADGVPGQGGQMTEVRIYDPGALLPPDAMGNA
jgi:FtsP/CotA-like multicopper oxidase with cupredoxin domain